METELTRVSAWVLEAERSAIGKEVTLVVVSNVVSSGSPEKAEKGVTVSTGRNVLEEDRTASAYSLVMLYGADAKKGAMHLARK